VNISMDDRIKQAFEGVLGALGCAADSEHFMRTPERVAAFYGKWITTGDHPPLTTFAAENYDEVVISGGLSFHSMCAHHMLPFFGHATVGYLPSDRIVGLSKLARVVDHFAHRLQTQEQLGKNIASFLQRELSPRGLAVVLSAEHLCMSMRGVQKPGHTTVTSVMMGSFREDAAARAEFLALTRFASESKR
jgi:GTP cyclohydrolase I